MRTTLFATLAGAAGALVLSSLAPAQAAPLFTVGAQLLGDPRPNTPNDIVVDVSVVVDDASQNRATFTVDINSPLHPTARLDNFAWNLVNTLNKYSPANVSFQNVSPTGWAGKFTVGNNVQGGGNITFLWEGDANNQNNAANNVTNSVNLVFDMVLNSGTFLLSDFLNAPTSTGAGGALQGQLGAHLISLGANGQGSGFAVANWQETGNGGGPGPIPAPEPMSLALFGMALAGLGAAARRRRQPA
jgi:hypothetical protein